MKVPETVFITMYDVLFVLTTVPVALEVVPVTVSQRVNVQETEDKDRYNPEF